METTNKIVLETTNFTTIFNACEDALINHKMIVIIGATGFGKSVGVDSFQVKYGDCVIIVRSYKSLTPRLLISSIYNEIGDENYNPSLPIYYIIRKAANVFSSQSRNMLLVIDEAGKLSPTMLQYLHEFRDITKNNTGIVLLGVDYLKNHLDSWSQKGKEGVPEFYGRINAFQSLSAPTYDEIVAIIHAHKIYDNKFIRECRYLKDFREVDSKIGEYNFLKNHNSN